MRTMMSQESRYALVDGRRYIHKYDVTSGEEEKEGGYYAIPRFEFFR